MPRSSPRKLQKEKNEGKENRVREEPSRKTRSSIRPVPPDIDEKKKEEGSHLKEKKRKPIQNKKEGKGKRGLLCYLSCLLVILFIVFVLSGRTVAHFVRSEKICICHKTPYSPYQILKLDSQSNV